LEPGYIEPSNAFIVRASSPASMTVFVGSNTAKTDVYVVEGRVTGQGNYLVRHDSTPLPISVPTANPAQTRRDEVYLVVRADGHASSARARPQAGHRQGGPGGSNPGADSTWKAYALLARITVPAGATSIASSNITDMRSATAIKTELYQGGTDELYYTKSQI